MKTRDTRNCPYCGEEILAVAKKCKHCGEWLPKDEEPKEAQEEVQPEQTPVEPEVISQPKPQESPTIMPSEKVQEDATTEMPHKIAEPSRWKKSKYGYLICAVIGIVLLLGVIWFFIPSETICEKADKLYLENKFGEATALYQKAADNGKTYAMWRLAKAYKEGNGVEFSLETAFEWLKKAADNGCEEAISDLAFAYLGVEYNLPIDTLKGVNMIKQLLSDSNNSYALSNCAYAYIKGFGKYFEKDYDEAYKILQRVEDKDNPLYNYMMGNVYQNGTSSIEADVDKAVQFFKKAYDLGEARAAIRIGALYCEGIQYKKDYQKAVEWFKKGVEKNSPQSMLCLAWLYDSDFADTKNLHNDQKAYDLLKKAISHGNCGAYNKLAFWYSKGKFVEKDEQKAIELYKESAKLGDPGAMLKLGYFYFNGIGTDKDLDAAEKMWITAAKRGSGEAAWNLSIAYQDGSFERSGKKSNYYFLKAVDLNDPNALYVLGNSYLNGIEGLYQKDDAKAFVYMKKAADLNQVDACKKLAYMYLNGIGCEKNINLANEYSAKSGMEN